MNILDLSINDVDEVSELLKIHIRKRKCGVEEDEEGILITNPSLLRS